MSKVAAAEKYLLLVFPIAITLHERKGESLTDEKEVDVGRLVECFEKLKKWPLQKTCNYPGMRRAPVMK